MSFELNPNFLRFVTVSIEVEDDAIVLVLYFTIKACITILLACASDFAGLAVTVWDLEVFCPMDKVAQLVQSHDWMVATCNQIRFDSIHNF